VSATSFNSSTQTRFDGDADLGNGMGKNNIDGADFGLASTDASVNNDGLKTHFIVVNSVVLTLNGTVTDADLQKITNVAFTYGSEQEGFNAGPGSPVPEPGTLALALTGLVGFGLARLCPLRRKAAA
jgi:hypothetical protein